MAKKDKLGFDFFVRLSWVYVAIYCAFLLISLVFTQEKEGILIFFEQDNLNIDTYKFNILQLLLSLFLAITLGIIFVNHSDFLTNFYDRLKYFGILDVTTNRKGQDPSLTQKWINRIKDSKELIIVGTSARGWFIYAKGELNNVLSENDKMSVQVFLLNPLGLVWKSKLDGFFHGYHINSYTKQYIDVLSTLIDFKTIYETRIEVWFYDIEPISCVITDKYLYYALYLPLEARTDVPELKLDKRSEIGEKIYKEITENLKQEKQKSFELSLDDLKHYEHIMTAIDRKKTEAEKRSIIFSNVITCDFCKEYNGLPSTYDKLYSKKICFEDRIIKKYDNFFIVPSLGQIVDNYLLITSNSHITGSSQLNDCAYKELSTIKSNIVDINKNKENTKTLFFEHGVPYEGIQCFGGCGITHLHIHAIPISNTEPKQFFNKLDEFMQQEITTSFETFELEDWQDAKRYKNYSYLLVEFDGSIKVYVFGSNIINKDKDIIDTIPSQLLRKFIKQYSNSKKDHDWKNYNDEYKDIQSVKDFFKEKLGLNKG